ncbi:MAG: histidine kinase [Kangiellaceae bacterium]|nr:histidine kinase [Kangiellaceae bacterium]MCW9000006.1 histidine kinase [Kangiellaceae bacterium]
MIRKLTISPGPQYWIANLILWGSFAVAWYFLHSIVRLTAPELALFNTVQVFILCFALSFLARQLFYILKLFEPKSKWAFIYSIPVFIFLGLAVALVFRLNIAFYYIVNEHATEIVFFLNEYILAAIPIVAAFVIWGVTLQTATNFSYFRKVQEDNESISLKLQEAQLNTLIGQLNPHFLFNGLNNIRSLILEDAPKARDMITSLSEILRYSLMSHKTKQVELQDELDVVEAYIELARIQYENRFIFSMDLDSSLVSRRIPPMSIQLLIENAVKHGIDRVVDNGILELSIQKIQDDKLLIQVKNSGEYNPDKTRANQRNTGIGLTNIRDRIHLLYGEGARLTVEQQGDLVVAKLVLPQRMNKESA